MLPNTSARDDDQVVTRWANTHGMHNHNVIMVDQLWLWWTLPTSSTVASKRPTDKIQSGASSSPGRNSLVQSYTQSHSVDSAPLPYLISAFPDRIGAGAHGVGIPSDLRSLVLDPVRGRRLPITRPGDLLERILATCFGVLDKLESD